MLRRLFSIEPLARTGDVVRLDPQESHHGRHVLRLGRGDGVVVFDRAGRQFAATVERFENKRLVVVLGEPTPAAPEPPVPVALYLALVKGDAFESVLQRAVELGVTEIVPFVAERSVPMVGKGAALERKIERWRQILLGATKQCGRACRTAITPPLPFADALCRPNEPALRFCCVPDPDAPEMSKMLQVVKPASAPSLAVIIGPEGGLSPDEMAKARRSDWHLVSLGPRTLRVETAAAAALTLILGSLDEM